LPQKPATNKEIADLLNRIADLLDAEGENPFRVRSYRRAAASVSSVRQSLASLVRENGAEGLSGLEGIGEKLAGLIQEFVEKGKVELLQGLEKEVPEEKLKAVEARKTEHSFVRPIQLPVATILEIDEIYRKQVAAGKLKMIAPRLLNPQKKSWLPLMAREYKGYKFTVMFSNTATAHKLGKTDEWVVVYYEKGNGENQCTVVTESRGPCKGMRVIRGREKECEKYYAR
jgi:DNA polymerase (family X)